MTYYNTNNELGDELRKSREKTETQEDLVLRAFRRTGKPLSPSFLVPLFPETPLTSIRRAITDLANAGYLEKTETLVQGTYGKNEHQWRLKNFKESLF